MLISAVGIQPPAHLCKQPDDAQRQSCSHKKRPPEVGIAQGWQGRGRQRIIASEHNSSVDLHAGLVNVLGSSTVPSHQQDNVEMLDTAYCAKH